MGQHLNNTSSYSNLLSTYADEATTHGIRKISTSHRGLRKIFWVFVFLTSLTFCSFHFTYLISMYVSLTKGTITRERKPQTVDFPALTVCNLNVIKRAYAETYFDHSKGKASTTKQCFQSETELLSESAVDLSDTWLNLGLTKDDLSRYGHQSRDLIVQCTYNSKDCFSNQANFRVVVLNFTSPIFGLCHTISVRHKKENRGVSVKKSGITTGLRLTLNIEREEYWDLISAEIGVRLLVHPQFTFPTLKRGGVVASPGSSSHIGVRRKVSTLLPGMEGSCSIKFADSKLIDHLQELGLEFDLSNYRYTYERCNTLCENTILFDKCGCLDEQPSSTKDSSGWKFCNPCNKQQASCRARVYRTLNEIGNICDDFCKPACWSVRYELTMSKADWPNFRHQHYVMNRSWEQWARIPQVARLIQKTSVDEEEEMYLVNDTFFRENLLRIHLYMEEMVYMSIQEFYSYSLVELIADLGGCLGLYLGVSVVSIIELIELLGNASIVCLFRKILWKTPDNKPMKIRRMHLRCLARPSAHLRSARKSGIRTAALEFLQTRKESRDERTWRLSPFSSGEKLYQRNAMMEPQTRIRKF